jgi:hypothetical protein
MHRHRSMGIQRYDVWFGVSLRAVDPTPERLLGRIPTSARDYLAER